MAKSPEFDAIVKAYKDRYGVDLSHMTMHWSKHPVYTNGERSYDFADDETGGSWVNDSTVRINPNMGPVMKRFGITGMTQREFKKRLISHELAHEIWRKQHDEKNDLINKMLTQAKSENFTTPYLPTVPKHKLDEETFAEYMSDQLNKKAQVVDHDKWPDNFHEYQKAHNDKIVWLARKAVIDDRKNRGKWGLATSDGKFLSSDDDVDDEEKLKSVIIRAGEAAKRARRASCHELAESILNRLRENKINARRIFVDKDRYNGVAMGHSTVFFQGDDGHWHRATNGIGARKKSRLGDFDSLEDAIDQYIAVEKANKQTTDDERVDAYDTTDLPFTDNMPWPDYKALARTGKRIYHQEKKAGARDFSGLLKLASPFLRRIKSLPPDVLKRINITPNLYTAFLKGDGPVFVPGSLSKANRRHTLRFSDLMSKDLNHVLDDNGYISAARDNIRRRIGTYVPNYRKGTIAWHNLPEQRITELNRNGIYTVYDLLQAQGDRAGRGEQIISRIKERSDRLRQLQSEMDDIRSRLPALAETKGLTAAEFDKLHPDKTSMFKGGLYTNLWPINEPGWMTGRKSVAYGYLANPTGISGNKNLPFITVGNRADSKALRKGRTFFTGHVASGNKRERLDAMKDGIRFHDVPTKADMFPDYEIVLPGSDMQRMPAKTYFVQPSNGGFGNVRMIMDGDVPFSQVPAEFHKITDQRKFNQLVADIMSNAKRKANVQAGMSNWQHRLAREGSVFQAPDGIDGFIDSL